MKTVNINDEIWEKCRIYCVCNKKRIGKFVESLILNSIKAPASVPPAVTKINPLPVEHSLKINKPTPPKYNPNAAYQESVEEPMDPDQGN
jgi:hypothetical protein